MDSKQLKAKLHESIENINNIEVLKTMNEISMQHYTIIQEPELNEYQIKRLSESEQQIQDGNFYTEKQANELIEKWLSK